ncbi:MAG: hypothetical protein QOI02_1328, partial [Actinomycetota bacterium]|nr:hypothetical protein [Actinomycetota bacterium]
PTPRNSGKEGTKSQGVASLRRMVDREILYCASVAEWAEWMLANATSSPGVRLAIARKGREKQSVTRAEALDIALRHGWIDGQSGSLDEDYWLQSFGPRRSRSTWSQINRDSALALIESGQMQPAGLAEVERAKADGRWDAAYASPSSATVPDDLASALAANPTAQAFFGTLSSQNRYAVLFRIATAKRAETRARKITEFVAMLERGETIYPQKTPSP